MLKIKIGTDSYMRFYSERLNMTIRNKAFRNNHSIANHSVSNETAYSPNSIAFTVEIL